MKLTVVAAGMLAHGGRASMTGRALRRYQMLLRVRAFGQTHADAFPPGSPGAEIFDSVCKAVSRLEQDEARQSRARSRGAVHAKNTARTRLRRLLRLISRTARAVAEEPQAFAETFRVPRTNGNDALLAAARAFAQHARPYQAAFVGFALPPAFLDELDVAIKTLEQESRDYAATRQSGVAATAGVDVVLREAARQVRRLDVVVANIYRSDPASLATWQAARHHKRV